MSFRSNPYNGKREKERKGEREGETKEVIDDGVFCWLHGIYISIYIERAMIFAVYSFLLWASIGGGFMEKPI